MRIVWVRCSYCDRQVVCLVVVVLGGVAWADVLLLSQVRTRVARLHVIVAVREAVCRVTSMGELVVVNEVGVK